MIRLILAVWVGKLLRFIARFLKFGGGSAAPGLYALKFDPDLIQNISRQIKTNVIITGTNGKTTTAKFLAHFASANGLTVVRNSTGSNLERGIASALIQHADLSGQVKTDLGIWEADEAAFNKIVFKIKPQVMVFLNAFRDQLDRYGEVDTVVKQWQESLSKIDWRHKILINASDANIVHLGEGGKDCEYFQVKGLEVNWEKTTQKGTRLKASFLATVAREKGLEGTIFDLRYPGGQRRVDFTIPGAYHLYDFLAAFAVSQHLGFDPKSALESLKTFQPAFGRVETVKLGQKEAIIFLIKNPVGATLVFETIAPSITDEDVLILALNDNFADGTDVSWIWDAHFERLSDSKSYQIICSGQRAEDLGVRLKYAGIDVKRIGIVKDLDKSIELAKSKSKNRIYIMPTYTALLQFQKLFTKLGVKEAYWRGS